MATAERIRGEVISGKQRELDRSMPSLAQLSAEINKERMGLRIRVNTALGYGMVLIGAVGFGSGLSQLSREPFWGGIMLIAGGALMCSSTDMKDATASLRVELRRLMRKVQQPYEYK